MSRIIFTAIVAAVMSCVTMTAGDVYRYSGLLASASYYAVDVNNVSTSAYVIARDTRSQSREGSPEIGSSILIWLVVYDGASGQMLLEAYEEKSLLPDEFQIDENMRRARLNTTVNAVDYDAAQNVTLTIDLEFVATSRPTRATHHVNAHSPDGSIVIRSVGIQRYAEVTGSISGSANLTPEPFAWGDLYESTEFEVTVR